MGINTAELAVFSIQTSMPVELFLSPFMGPISKAHSAIMNIHRDSSHYTPHIVDKLEGATTFAVRKEFGTGSKVFSVFDNSDPRSVTYDKSLYHMTRSRAVKGAYRMYMAGDDKPIATLRAGLRSNVLLFKTATGSERELGWHVIRHRVDALDNYRMFELENGETYQWTYKGCYLEKVKNLGEKDSEVRERVGQVRVFANKRGFDLILNEDEVQKEMAIATALICYIEVWNNVRGYGGIYSADQHEPKLPWKRD